MQIEKSLTHVLKRDFARNGFNGLVKTWRAKSSKYVKDFVNNNLKDEFLANIRSTLADMIVVR